LWTGAASNHGSRDDAAALEERRDEIGGASVFWREAPARGGAGPTLYLHGVPTNSDDWLPFLERTGGVAPDLPGFGRSDKPAHFDYSIAGYTRFLAAFLDHLGLDRFSLVVHDWGAVGLGLAQAMPERVERLVAIAPVPFLPGYRWHRVAKIWRTPLIGELSMGYSWKGGMRRASREWLVAPGPVPEAMLESVWSHWDHGTQRAILKLYRSAPPATLAAAGEGLGKIKAPALILWGEDDPYLPPEFAQKLADALGGNAQVEVLEGARHWLWLDRPEVVDSVAKFLRGRNGV
jgi:pimeloyl-ACP methyl ester carboxylesterase